MVDPKGRSIHRYSQHVVKCHARSHKFWRRFQQTIQPHDRTCENIQNYARLRSGESSLYTYPNATVRCDPSPPNTSDTEQSHPPLWLASSFDTDCTHENSSSNSSTSSSSSSCNGNDVDDSVLSNEIEKSEYDDNITHYDGSRNHQIIAHRSQKVHIGNIDTFNDICDSDVVENVFITHSNESTSKATFREDLEIIHGEIRQKSNTVKPFLQPTNDSYINGENMTVEIQSTFLTRDLVLDKMEITKSKLKKPSKNIICHSGVSSYTDENHGTSDETEDNDDNFQCDDDTVVTGSKQECSICMEPFRVGDNISFSPTEGCHHVFHHDCLRQWLLRKTSCPCCRVIMLPIDRQITTEQRGELDDNNESTQSKPAETKTRMNIRNTEVFRERLHKKCGTYCCVACGVVVLKPDLREDLCTKISTRGIDRASIKGVM